MPNAPPAPPPLTSPQRRSGPHRAALYDPGPHFRPAPLPPGCRLQQHRVEPGGQGCRAERHKGRCSRPSVGTIGMGRRHRGGTGRVATRGGHPLTAGWVWKLGRGWCWGLGPGSQPWQRVSEQACGQGIGLLAAPPRRWQWVVPVARLGHSRREPALRYPSSYPA